MHVHRTVRSRQAQATHLLQVTLSLTHSLSLQIERPARPYGPLARRSCLPTGFRFSLFPFVRCRSPTRPPLTSSSLSSFPPYSPTFYRDHHRRSSFIDNHFLPFSLFLFLPRFFLCSHHSHSLRLNIFKAFTEPVQSFRVFHLHSFGFASRPLFWHARLLPWSTAAHDLSISYHQLTTNPPIQSLGSGPRSLPDKPHFLQFQHIHSPTRPSASNSPSAVRTR